MTSAALSTAVAGNAYCDVHALRLRGLDRTRRLVGFYRRVDRDPEQNRLKTAARAAAIAYLVAMEDGDIELADATHARFVAASKALVAGRQAP